MGHRRGWCGVLLYRRFTGFALDIRAGARLGSITGVLTFASLVVISTLTLTIGGQSEDIFKQFRQDPQMAQVLNEPVTLAAVFPFALVIMFAIVVGTCAAGGALGARYVSRTARTPESDRMRGVIFGLLPGLTFWCAANPDAGFTDTPMLPDLPCHVHDPARPHPKVVTPGALAGQPPSDAIVLFDGSGLSKWSAARLGTAAYTVSADPVRWKASRSISKLFLAVATSRRRKSSAMCNCTWNGWSRPVSPEPVRTGATAGFS